MFKSILIIASLFLVSACGGLSKRESPNIYFSNASNGVIKNIRCNWNGVQMSLPSLVPGNTRSQNFYIRKNSDFFGLVNVSWTAGSGKSFNKEFFFSEKHLPSLSEDDDYKYVQLYFDDYGAEVISSDIADLGGKTRRMEKILIERHNKYVKYHHGEENSNHLIKVQQKYDKDSSVPNWLMNSY